jgi:hypothetical protein
MNCHQMLQGHQQGTTLMSNQPAKQYIADSITLTDNNRAQPDAAWVDAPIGCCQEAGQVVG